MRMFSSLFISLCIAATWLSASDETKITPEQQEVISVHNRIREAALKRDFTGWSAYIAEDCIFSTDDGEIRTKAQLIEHGRNLPFAYDHSDNQREFVVHVYGDTAVLNLRFTSHEQFTDTDILTEMRETETFIRRDGSWVLIARQWGALPVNFRKPVAADPARYKDYAGQYEWRPGGPLDTVSVKDGKLLGRMNDESEDDEYLPLGPDTFFVKDDLGSVTFLRDSKGQVSGYTYHRSDGQEIQAKRIK
jgi:hypothetical protein